MKIALFLTYLTHEKKAAPLTISAYQTDLRAYEAYLKSQYDITDILSATRQMIRSWVVSMVKADHENTTIHRKLAALKSLYRFYQKNGQLAINPAARVLLPKKKISVTEVVPTAPLDELLLKLSQTTNFSIYRDYLIIELLYQTGMRRAELANLTDNAIDTARGTIRVEGKRGKVRLIPMGNRLRDAICTYQDLRNDALQLAAGGALLVTDKGKPIYPAYLYNKVRHYLTEVTTIERKSPHVLRHTFATHLAAEGANLNAIKELLGHTSLAATQRYTHNSIQRLKQSYDRAHPRSGK